MKAIVYNEYGGPDVLRYEEVATPVPLDGQVLIRVHAASINSWDWDMVRGRPYLVRMWGLRRPRYIIPGADIAGTVEDVGKNVTRFSPGDEVFGDLSDAGWGGFAQYVTAPAQSLTPKPPGISFQQAASLPQAGVMALQSLREKKRVEPGTRVLINGAGGGVGTIAIQLARSMGADVTGVDSSEKADLMRSLGAHSVIDYRAQDWTRGEKTYDLAIDVAAQYSVFQYRAALRPGGAYVMIGGATGRILQVVTVGAVVSALGDRKLSILAHEANRDLAYLGDLVSSGSLTPVIDRVYPLSNTAEAFRYYSSGDVRGKIVITMSD